MTYVFELPDGTIHWRDTSPEEVIKALPPACTVERVSPNVHFVHYGQRFVGMVRPGDSLNA